MSELPKIFDRNFVIAFLFPATLFVFFTLLLLDQTAWAAAVQKIFANDAWFGISTLGIVSFVLGILLAGFNYGLIRFLEGYLWPLNRFAFLRERQIRLCANIDSEIQQLEEKIRTLARQEQQPAQQLELRQLQNRRAKCMQQRVRRYPDSKSFILPTAFGNIVRAFESYPRVVYGLDGIPAWPRLQGVMSERTASQVSAAKIQLDLFVNLFYLSLLFITLVLISAMQLTFIQLLLCTLVLPFAIVSLAVARLSAVHWGEYVKSAFDLHINDLAESMNVELTEEAETRRDVWVKKSQSMIYHLPDV